MNLGAGSTLFDALIATAVDGIIVIGKDGVVEVYNDACTRLFGYQPDEVVGRNVRMLMPEPYGSRHDGYLSAFAQTGERHIIGVGREVMGRRKDGSAFPLFLSVGSGVSDGKPIYVGIIRDLTQLKEEVARGEKLDMLLAQIVADSDDAILSKTLDGTITSWNRGAQRIFGYTAAEVVGRHISLLIPPDRLAEEDAIITRLRAGEGIDHMETVRRARDGTDIAVSLSVSPLRDKDGAVTGASKIIRDVREKKQSEERLQLLQTELEHVARLNAMGQISSGIAHELNQPLTAIGNYINAARRTLAGAQPDASNIAIDLMSKAGDQIRRAGGIIRGLRDFIEKRDRRRQPEDVNEVIHEGLTLGLAGMAQENVRVVLKLGDGLPDVLVDRVQVEQVLINLIRNAFEAMQEVSDRVLTITTAAEDGFVQVTVQDTGPGLSDDVRKRLFLPFVTTKSTGMGIGLNICQSIVEAHGGTIVERGRAGHGAAFRFSLPPVPYTEIRA